MKGALKMYGYNLPSSSSSYALTSNLEKMNTTMLIIAIISIAVAIIVYVVFMPKENEKNLNGNVKKIYDFLHFKKLYIEDFLKIAYVFSAVFLTIMSFTTLTTSFGLFFFLIVFGNILLRIAYEFIMMLYRMYLNTKDINSKIK
jgi:hypothetical protein